MADTALISKPARLSQTDIALVLKYHADGMTQVDIAQRFNVSQPAISQLLARFEDTSATARLYTRNAALKLAERIVKDADVEQSLEVLDRLEVLPRREQAGNRTGVQINIGMPGQAIGLDPLEPVNVISNYQTQSPSEGQ